MYFFGWVFGAPFHLIWLAVIPAYLLWRMRVLVPTRLQLTLSYDPTLSGPSATRWAWVRHVPPMLTLLGLATLILALARPQRIESAAPLVSEGIDILVALDISESMDADDLPPSRFDAAKDLARRWVTGRERDRIGVALFGQDAVMMAPFTSDVDFVLTQLDDVRPTTLPRQGTALGNALGVAYTQFQDRKGTRVVLLITDGVNNRGVIDPISASKLLAEIGVRVYTVGVGRALKGREQGYDAAALKQIAALTGGEFFEATDPTTLMELWRTLGTLERTPSEGPATRKVVDLYPSFLLVGLLLLCLAWVLTALGLANLLEE